MKKFNKISTLLLVAVLLISIVGCTKAENEVSKKINYADLKTEAGLASGNMEENNNYILTWDSERACIGLTEKATGKIWSTIPYDFYTTGKTTGRDAIMMGAPLMLSYVHTSNTRAIKTVNGYTGVIKNGKTVCKKIENGIRVEYYFDKLEIMIPVDFVLRENGVCASIALGDIVENENLVYKISLTPFLCSTVNSDNKDEQYIVVPSGSGALMYTYNRSGERKYSENVYGNDSARYENEKLTNTKDIRVPVFGAKNGAAAICGIIEEGAACGSVEASVGDSEIGYSAVYPTFTIRGSNISAISFQDGKVSEVETISMDLSGYEKVSVGYYPLYGEKANYVGMAATYREFAKKAYDSDNKKPDDTRMTIKLLGGLQVKDSVLGIPRDKTVAATTFAEALDIVKQINELTDKKFDVLLSGFGNTGLDVGSVAGGFKFGKVFGGKKAYKALKSYCDENGIGLYSDFDVIRFNKSGNGFSKTYHASKASSMFTAYQYQYSVSLRNIDENYKKYVLLNRSQLGNAVKKLVSFSDKNDIGGLSLSTLGSMSYSDYSDPAFYARGGTENDVAEIIKNIKKKNISVMVSDANAYAAASADKITDAPVSSSQFDATDSDIPLYQMIFKGFTDVSSEAINIANIPRKQFLKALEGGSGIEFVLSAKYDTDFATTKHSVFAVSQFSDNKESISEYIKESSNFYDSIAGTEIVEHRVISNDLRYTKFSNGTQLWINYGETPVTIDSVTVEPNGFVVKEG